MNGFGGGGKIVFPGMADFDSIREHHLKWTFHPGTLLGRTAGNVFHEELVQMAGAAGLDFILNTVLDQNDRVAQVVAGDPIQAHRAGIEISKNLISHAFDQKSDLTLITSFPYAEGPQIMKPLGPASLITREGGCIILAADCTGNLPDAFVKSFASFHDRYGGRLLEGVLEHFKDNRLIMEQGAVDFNMALGMTLAIQDRFRVILLSKDISRKQAEGMGFRYAGTMKEALELSSTMCPVNPGVHVVPAGGIILPKFYPGESQR
jgi:nickel-dependent lactate racemase